MMIAMFQVIDIKTYSHKSSLKNQNESIHGKITYSCDKSEYIKYTIYCPKFIFNFIMENCTLSSKMQILSSFKLKLYSCFPTLLLGVPLPLPQLTCVSLINFNHLPHSSPPPKKNTVHSDVTHGVTALDQSLQHTLQCLTLFYWDPKQLGEYKMNT